MPGTVSAGVEKEKLELPLIQSALLMNKGRAEYYQFGSCSRPYLLACSPIWPSKTAFPGLQTGKKRGCAASRTAQNVKSTLHFRLKTRPARRARACRATDPASGPGHTADSARHPCGAGQVRRARPTNLSR
jgi:hypothetical protein